MGRRRGKGIYTLGKFSDMNDELKVLSLNVNGVQDISKRRLMCRYLRQFKRSIICLQETHLTNGLSQVLECHWGHKVILNGCSSQECGVAILFTKDLDCTWEILFRDRLGRCFIIKVTLNDVSIVVCNMYFHTADNECMQLRLLEQLEGVLLPYEGDNIIAGDFNVVMNRKLESFNLVSQAIRNRNFRSELSVTLETFSLCDPWRIRNWSEKLFRWSRAGKGSRLDYIFTPTCWLNLITSTAFYDVPFSDHRLIYVGFNTKKSERGKGFWRVSNHILEKEEVLKV